MYLQQRIKKTDIVKVLHIVALVSLVALVLSNLWQIIGSLIDAPFGFRYLLLNLFSLTLRLVEGAFPIAVLLALAEIIQLKRQGK